MEPGDELEAEDLKILVILFYYDRPNLVKIFLQSLKEQTYKNWELVFIDDSEQPLPGFKSLTDIFGTLESLKKIKYITTQDTQTQKEERGGSLIGKFANEAMLESKADIAIIGCDDDALLPTYFEKLNAFYKSRPFTSYSYCDAVVFNPLVDNWRDKLGEPASEHFINTNHNPHCMGNSKDSSQGSWRLDIIRTKYVRFPHPLTACLDYHMWMALYQVCGMGVFNGITGVLKAYWPKQLGGRGNTYGNTE